MNLSVFRASCCALTIALLAACGDGADKGAAADSTAQFTAAADALSAKLSAGQIPPASDPAVKAFDDQSAKALQTLGTPALPVKGFDSYDALCGKTATIVGAYVNTGVGQLPEAQRIDAMNANAEKYLDQMFTPLIFSAHCSAAHMPFIEKTVGSNVGQKRAALEQVRNGAYGQVSGMLEMAAANDLDAARRARIIDLLATDAANFAIIFSAQQRQALSGMAEQTRAGLPESSRGAVDRIKSGLQQAPCGSLCTM